MLKLPQSPFRSQGDNDYGWFAIWQHWGLQLTTGASILFSWVVLFLLNLNGTPWICLITATFLLMLSGGGLLLRAKLPAYRSGRFFTFGAKSVPEPLHANYRWGWRLFLLGAALNLFLLIGK